MTKIAAGAILYHPSRLAAVFNRRYPVVVKKNLIFPQCLVLLFLGAGIQSCGDPKTDQPKSCSSNALGERHCDLQTGRQKS